MAQQAEKAKVLLDMLRLGWGDENHAYLQVWASLFQPGGSIEHLRSWSELQRQSTSPEAAVLLFEATFNVDVEASARRVRCPTLLISPERDLLVPLEEGRRLARLIPGARFVPLDTNNHMPLADEPAWQRLVAEMDSFLAEERNRPGRSCASADRFADLTEREREVLEAVACGHDNGEIALAKACDLSLHVEVQTLDDVLHSLKIEARAIVEVFGASCSENRSYGQMVAHRSALAPGWGWRMPPIRSCVQAIELMSGCGTKRTLVDLLRDVCFRGQSRPTPNAQ